MDMLTSYGCWRRVSTSGTTPLFENTQLDCFNNKTNYTKHKPVVVSASRVAGASVVTAAADTLAAGIQHSDPSAITNFQRKSHMGSPSGKANILIGVKPAYKSITQTSINIILFPLLRPFLIQSMVYKNVPPNFCPYHRQKYRSILIFFHWHILQTYLQ